MQLSIKWHKPVELLDGHKQDLIYTIDDLDQWDEISGVYMLCRQFGGKTIPLYIGKAENISTRIKQHLNTTKLMTKLRKGVPGETKGKRVVVVGEFTAKSAQSTKKCIGIIERSLIAHALANGYTLLNVKGTNTPTHDIEFSGYLQARMLTGKLLSVAAK